MAADAPGIIDGTVIMDYASKTVGWLTDIEIAGIRRAKKTNTAI